MHDVLRLDGRVKQRMRQMVGQLWDQLSARLILEDTARTAVAHTAAPSLPDAVERARQEWLSAKAYFDSVIETELVDHAIYTIEAAERKYMYLLKQARDAGVEISLEVALVSNAPARGARKAYHVRGVRDGPS